MTMRGRSSSSGVKAEQSSSGAAPPGSRRRLSACESLSRADDTREGREEASRAYGEVGQRYLAVDLDAALHLALELLLHGQFVGRDSVSASAKNNSTDITHVLLPHSDGSDITMLHSSAILCCRGDAQSGRASAGVPELRRQPSRLANAGAGVPELLPAHGSGPSEKLLLHFGPSSRPLRLLRRL